MISRSPGLIVSATRRSLTTLSFASPESDFTAQRMPTTRSGGPIFSETISFASPDADFCGSPALSTFSQAQPTPAVSFGPSWTNSMSFASPESDFVSAQPLAKPLAIPKSLKEAMQSPHAVIVTTLESPHRIVHVNASWEKLCGFTQQEVLYQTLKVIQGQDTNLELASSTLAAVSQSETPYADMYVINYKKNKSPFKNHVRMSTMKLSEEDNDVEFMVGVLEEVDHVPLRMI